jgi:hypothetical protein
MNKEIMKDLRQDIGIKIVATFGHRCANLLIWFFLFSVETFTYSCIEGMAGKVRRKETTWKKKDEECRFLGCDAV